VDVAVKEKITAGLKNPVVAALISAAVTLLIAGLTFAMSYGRVTSQVEQIVKQAERISLAVSLQVDQTNEICQRLASLEAWIVILQRGLNGGTP
jgi:hypothetical protein